LKERARKIGKRVERAARRRFPRARPRGQSLRQRDKKTCLVWIAAESARELHHEGLRRADTVSYFRAELTCSENERESERASGEGEASAMRRVVARREAELDFGPPRRPESRSGAPMIARTSEGMTWRFG